MRETIKGSCKLSHCQIDNGTCVSQYFCSSESTYTENREQTNEVSMYQDSIILTHPECSLPV